MPGMMRRGCHRTYTNVWRRRQRAGVNDIKPGLLACLLLLASDSRASQLFGCV